MMKKYEVFSKYDVTKCAISGCENKRNHVGTNLRFYFFPNRDKFPLMWKKWVKACGRPGYNFPRNGVAAAVCGEHFTYKDFELSGKKIRLSPRAIPNRRLPSPDCNVAFTTWDRQKPLKPCRSLEAVSGSPVNSNKCSETLTTFLSTDQYGQARNFEMVLKTRMINEENFNNDITRRIIHLSTTNAVEAMQVYREMYKAKQKKEEDELKARPPNYLIDKYKALESFEVIPVSLDTTNSSKRSEPSAQELSDRSADFSAILQPTGKPIYRTFAEYRTKPKKQRFDINDILRNAPATTKFISSLSNAIGTTLAPKNNGGIRETMEADGMPPTGPHAAYIRGLNSLNTAVIPVGSTKSSMSATNRTKQTDFRVTLRQAANWTTFSEEGVQCELGYEKYRTVQKLLTITKREVVRDIPVVTYNLPNDHREEKIQCELGVEALSTTKTLNSFLDKLH
uniref:THAP-type domain-containing protein n=1 Tax=Lygus hesperus TaxID=30085 RepID=A0A146KJI5_LYGHE